MLHISYDASTVQALECTLEKLRPHFTRASDHTSHRYKLPYFCGGQFPQPLGEGEIEEGDVDVLVGIIVGDEGGLLLHDEPLASIPEVRLEPQELVGDGGLEEVAEEHDVGEVDEDGAGLAGLHGVDLRRVVRRPSRVRIHRKALEEVEEDVLHLDGLAVDEVRLHWGGAANDD